MPKNNDVREILSVVESVYRPILSDYGDKISYTEKTIDAIESFIRDFKTSGQMTHVTVQMCGLIFGETIVRLFNGKWVKSGKQFPIYDWEVSINILGQDHVLLPVIRVAKFANDHDYGLMSLIEGSRVMSLMTPEKMMEMKPDADGWVKLPNGLAFRVRKAE